MNLQEFSLILIGIISLVIVYSFIGNLLEHKHWHFIHQTGVGILIGLSFGVITYYVAEIQEIQFNQQIFFYALLPPMIFAGGYNLKKKDFGKNFAYIITYGLIGTIVSFGIVFGLTVAINELHWIIPLRSQNHIEHLQTALIVKYSATISATDSVAALTLIKASEFPKLFSIIFGEGMVNDAVAIILFKVVGGLFDQINSEMTAGEILKTIVGSFIGTIFYSVFIGLLSALICAFLFKKCHFLIENEVTQVVLMYLFGILSYVVAEYFDESGVITVLVSGVALAHYNFYNLTVGGMHATTVTFQSISFIAEAIVFVYLGITTIYYFLHEVISLSFLALEICICVISRFTAIFGLSFICKKIMKDKWNVTKSELSIISLAGTIRGSVAFALILTIEADQQNQDQVSVIKSTTLAMVCITTIILGALMPKFIHCFLGEKNQSIVSTQQLKAQLIKKAEKKKNKKKGFFGTSDETYWRPFFINDYVENRQIFNIYKRVMKFNSRGDYKGGSFYLLDLVQADNGQLKQFVEMLQKSQQISKVSDSALEQGQNPNEI